MSESMSKSEIEDVVSSIRRLVTEEQLQQQRPVTPSSDKLVLTPAQRIEPSLPDVRQPLRAAEPLSLVPEQKVDPAASAAHQAAAALEAALMRQRDDWEPEGTELFPSLRSSFDWDLPEDSEAADVIGPTDAVPTGGEPADHLPIPAEPLMPAEPLIPDEPRIPDEPPVPAEAPAAMAVDSTPGDAIYWDDYLAVHRSTPLLAAEQAELWRPAPAPVAGPPADLSGFSAITDAAHGQLAAGSGPESAPEPLQQTALPPSGQVEDAAGPADGDQPATLPSDRLADQGVFDRPLDDGTSSPPVMQDVAPGIDDALLRDLIRDVLREELRGELGERITRNVRKLVRAELARALAARDLT